MINRLFSKQLDSNPSAPALISSHLSLTYAELSGQLEHARKYIRNFQLPADSTVAIVAENNIESIVLLYALWFEQHPVALLSNREPSESIEPLLKQLNPSIVFVADKHKFVSETFAFQSIPNLEDSIPVNSVSFPERSLESNATIVFTSGSTGEPNGIIHTFGNHYYSALGANENMPLNNNDRWLLALPWYHVGGLAILFRVLLAGATVVLPDKNFSLAENCQKYQVTHLSVVPTQLQELIHNPFEQVSLKAVLVGGAACPEQLISKAYDAGLPIYTTYGSTEAASQVTTTQPNDTVEHLLTSGKPLPYREILLAEDGEILIKGKTLAAQTLQGPLPLDAEGYYHTGDIGEFTDDGYLKVIGRKDAMFISGGENIYPEEIEKSIKQLCPDQEVIVVGIDNEKYGKRPVAFINGKCDKDWLNTNLLRTMAKYKIPDFYFPFPDDYKTTGIKLSREYFRKLAEKIIAKS